MLEFAKFYVREELVLRNKKIYLFIIGLVYAYEAKINQLFSTGNDEEFTSSDVTSDDENDKTDILPPDFTELLTQTGIIILTGLTS